MRALASLPLLLGAGLLAACGPAAPPPPSGAGADGPAATPPPAAAAPALTDAERAAALAALPAPYNGADLENGQRRFALCRSCHMISPNGGHMTGPNLYAVFGRQAGSAERYNYSAALRAAGFTWDAERLDHWLENPRTFLPGNKMTFAGVRDEADRRDLIAYLMIETAPRPAAGSAPAAAPAAP